jgi:hypothetical protein
MLPAYSDVGATLTVNFFDVKLNLAGKNALNVLTYK